MLELLGLGLKLGLCISSGLRLGWDKGGLGKTVLFGCKAIKAKIT